MAKTKTPPKKPPKGKVTHQLGEPRKSKKHREFLQHAYQNDKEL